jgi:hypothetical protein
MVTTYDKVVPKSRLYRLVKCFVEFCDYKLPHFLYDEEEKEYFLSLQFIQIFKHFISIFYDMAINKVYFLRKGCSTAGIILGFSSVDSKVLLQ